jgi:hypothetical protein
VTAAPQAPERVPLRLLLSESADAGRLDGAWWPQSSDLGVEFADLADNFPTGLGRIVNVAYSKSCWDPAPTWLDVAPGRRVRTRTFLGTADPDRVLLRLYGHRTLLLMVVPPELEAAAAARAMRTAASSANRQPARALIAEAAASSPSAAPRGSPS